MLSWIAKVTGGLAIVAGSFFLSLAVIDHFGIPPGVILIHEATYGGNCTGGKRPGNASELVRQLCTHRSACSIAVDFRKFGDPASGCAKDFSVTWACGREFGNRTSRIEAEAHGQTVELSCQR